MSTARSFQEILDLLHIDVISSQVESVQDMIREAYTVRTYVVQDYEEFKREIQRYYEYHSRTWMEVDSGALILGQGGGSGTALSRASELTSGHAQAFKRAKTGRNGGLLGVINEIAENFKKVAIQQYVDSVLKNSINPLDFYTKVDFMEEYLRRYGVLLSGEEHMTAYEMAADIEGVINRHVGMINMFRNIVQ